MKNLPFLAFLIILVISCKGKKENPADDSGNGKYFPLVNFLNSQAKAVDTSLYRITVINQKDSVFDTSIIAREDFRKYAKDFLELPDIASDDNKDRYTEDLSYDQDLDASMMNYTPKDNSLPVRRETILMKSDENANTNVNTILVNTLKTDGDSTVEKDMTWHVGQRFQVITKVSRKNQPEQIRRMIVKWE